MADSGFTAPSARILLVDDDRVFGLWASKVLRANGFEIQHVLDPVAGLSQVESGSWDLVITDVEMPRMSGLEFLERARRMAPGVPMAVVTGHATVDRAVTAMQQSAIDFIQKPIQADAFVARITELAAQGRRAQAPEHERAAERVLAVGAHPGDVEIGAGGTLLAHAATGAAITVLTLSGVRDQAAQEGGQPGARVGIRVDLRDLAGGDAADPDGAVTGIGSLISRDDPTIVYTHSVHDTQSDHRRAHLAVMKAAHRTSTIYCFQSPSTTIDFRPTRFVPIDAQIEAKIGAVRAFGTQPEVRDALQPDLITTTAGYWARYCGARYGEAFEVVRDHAASAASPDDAPRLAVET